MSKGWDNATLKKLKALTGKGLSTSEIGKRLGMSKNAVVGKLNRLGWNLKAGGTAAAASAKLDAAAKKPAKKTVAVKKTAAVKEPAKTKKAPAPKVAVKKPAATSVKKTAPAKTTTVPAKNEKTPAKSSAKGEKSLNKNLAMHQRIIQHSLEMANLKPNQCRWPIGDPDSENFHFCGETVFVGKPYCYEHCKQAYQFNPPKKKA